MIGQAHLPAIVMAGGEAGIDGRDQVIEQGDHRAVGGLVVKLVGLIAHDGVFIVHRGDVAEAEILIFNIKAGIGPGVAELGGIFTDHFIVLLGLGIRQGVGKGADIFGRGKLLQHLLRRLPAVDHRPPGIVDKNIAIILAMGKVRVKLLLPVQAVIKVRPVALFAPVLIGIAFELGIFIITLVVVGDVDGPGQRFDRQESRRLDIRIGVKLPCTGHQGREQHGLSHRLGGNTAHLIFRQRFQAPGERLVQLQAVQQHIIAGFRQRPPGPQTAGGQHKNEHSPKCLFHGKNLSPCSILITTNKN